MAADSKDWVRDLVVLRVVPSVLLSGLLVRPLVATSRIRQLSRCVRILGLSYVRRSAATSVFH